MIGILLLTISATATAQYRPPRMSSGFHQNIRGAPLATSASKDRPYVSIPIVLMQDGKVVPKPTQASYQYLGNLPGHLSSVQGSQQESAGNYQVVLPTSHPSQGLFKKNPPARSAKQQRPQVYQKGNPNIANFLNLATQLGAQELQRNVQHQQAQQEAQKHQEQQQQFQGQQGNVYAQPPQVQQMQKSIQNANTQQYANYRQPVQQVSTTQQQSVHFPHGRQQAQANAYQQQTQHGYNHQHANQGAPMANPSGSSKQQAFAPQPVLEIYDVNSQAVNQAHSSVNQALANQMGQQQYAVADPNASPVGYPNLSYQAQQQVPQVSQNYYISPQDQKMLSAYQSQQSSQANVPNHSVVQQGNSNGSPQQPYAVVPNFQNVYTPQNGQTVISSQNNNQASIREPSPQLVSYSFINEQQQQPKQESHIPNNSYQTPSGYQLTPPLTNNYQNPATFSNTNNYQTSINAANYQSSSPSSYQSSPNNYQSANPALNSYQTSNQESNSYQTSNQESNSYQTPNQESNSYQNANQESNNYQTANQEYNGYQAANNNYPSTNQASSVPQSSSQTNNYQISVPSSNYQSPGSSTNNHHNSAPSTSNNYQSSAPSTSNNYQSSAPSTSNSYQSSAPSTNHNYQSSAPSTSNNYQSSAPSTSNSYQSSAPSTNHNYQSSAPSTSNSYQSSAPSTNSYSVPATSSYQVASYQNPQQSATTPKQQESSNSGGQLIFASTSAKQINYSPSETSYPSTQQQGNASPANYGMESSSTPSASGLVTPGSTYVKLSQSMAASLGVTSPSQGDQDNDYEDADEEETSYKVVYIPLDILKNILSNNVESNQRSDKES